jgi:hypothetical protein
MALIIRIDADRPYGRQPFLRRMFSRVSSDLYFPKWGFPGYLKELGIFLRMLNDLKARAYIFFRRCTLPSSSIRGLIRGGGHRIGLHLEDSRSFDTFLEEKRRLERHVGEPIIAVSKHGSGEAKHGFHHYAPYEPDRYLEWARRSGMRLLLGNLEDPTLRPIIEDDGFCFYPSAFWLEPPWRDRHGFTVDWLLSYAETSDVVLLVHPENVLADATLLGEFRLLARALPNRILS